MRRFRPKIPGFIRQSSGPRGPHSYSALFYFAYVETGTLQSHLTPLPTLSPSVICLAPVEVWKKLKSSFLPAFSSPGVFTGYISPGSPAAARQPDEPVIKVDVFLRAPTTCDRKPERQHACTADAGKSANYSPNVPKWLLVGR